MMKFYTHMLRVMLPAFWLISLQSASQTISADVGAGDALTICKGQTVVMTADNAVQWEFSTNNGISWTPLINGYSFSTANIGNGYQYRGQYYDFMTDENQPTNTLVFTVNGEQVGTNTITSPNRGSISFNGNDQAFQITPGIAVETNPFTFDGWFRLNAIPISNDDPNMFTLFGAGNGGSRPISIIVSDARTIRFQSFGWGSLDFTIPKLSTGVWYHLALVRDANY